MSFIATLEKKFGRYAIPDLIATLAILQALCWFLIKLVPEFDGHLIFDPTKIMQGEWWRVISYLVLPGNKTILFLIFIGFIFMLSRGLEEAWGAFRVNLYILGGVVSVAIGGLIFGYSTAGVYLWMSVLFAFACSFPNDEIMLYMIIPLKMKWMAAISAVMLGLTIIMVPSMVWEAGFSLVNFFFVFLPGFLRGVRHQAVVSVRRERFEQAQHPSDKGEAFFVCVRCQKTDRSHPQLEFRVTSEGHDMCSECRQA
jgi:hypothetical protein